MPLYDTSKQPRSRKYPAGWKNCASVTSRSVSSVAVRRIAASSGNTRHSIGIETSTNRSMSVIRPVGPHFTSLSTMRRRPAS